MYICSEDKFLTPASDVETRERGVEYVQSIVGLSQTCSCSALLGGVLRMAETGREVSQVASILRVCAEVNQASAGVIYIIVLYSRSRNRRMKSE